jgi:hypothetical protein
MKFAYEIFKAKDEKSTADRKSDSVWASMNAPLHTGVVS